MKQKINISNYEEFLIDHLDGTLSVEREAELLLFLEAHPHIKEEFEGLDDIVLEVNSAAYDYHCDLKKNILDSGKINKENFEEYCIAFYENDLTEQEVEHLHNFVHDHPSLKHDFQLYAKLKLSENNSIQFPYKDQLQQFASSTSEAISENNYLDFLIARNENDLSLEREAELNAFLNANPQYKQEAKLVAGLKLQADKSVVFHNKSKLKRRAILIPLANKWVNVVAASIVLLIIFYALTPHQNFDEPIQNYPNETVALNTQIETPSHSNSSKNTQEDKIIKAESNDIQKLVKQQAKGTTQVAIQETKSTSRNVSPIASVSSLDCKGIEVETNIEVAAIKFPVEIIAQADILETYAKTGKSIELKGIVGKAVLHIGKFLGKSDRLKKDRINAQLQNLAVVAVNGFNKMTEGDISLPRKDKNTEDHLDK